MFFLGVYLACARIFFSISVSDVRMYYIVSAASSHHDAHVQQSARISAVINWHRGHLCMRISRYALCLNRCMQLHAVGIVALGCSMHNPNTAASA